jgi:hypothetical protein
MFATTLERALSIAAAVRPDTRAFVGDAYVPGQAGATFTTINPAPG